MHETGKFYYACAENYLEILNDVNKYKENGFDAVFGAKFPNCTIDGKYAPIQLDVEKWVKFKTQRHLVIIVFCQGGGFLCRSRRTPNRGVRYAPQWKHRLHELQSVFERFLFLCSFSFNTFPDCARSKRFLPKDSTEDLVCCPNGNYRKYQCRRGVCYCVDTDGYQNGNEEVAMYELDKLSCYQNSCYENEI